MIDIDEAVRLIEKSPCERLEYSYKDQCLYAGKGKGKRPCEDKTATLPNVRAVWSDAKRVFRTKHPSLFPNAPSSYSAKKWSEIIEDNHLEEEWFLELRDSLAPEITNLSVNYGLWEKEAEPELYQRIKKELISLEACEYEKYYYDEILFTFCTPYDRVSMTILGNAGMVKGICFYPGEIYGGTFLATIHQDRLGLDNTTSQSLSNMVSFYYEDEGDEDRLAPKDNPFGKDNHFTSMYMRGGTMMGCCLPKSIALRALIYLAEAKKRLPLFDRTYRDYPFNDGLYDVSLGEKGSFLVPSSDTFDLPFEIFPDIFDAKYPELDNETSGGEAWDATLRASPAPFEDPSNPDKISHWGYIALFTDHKTGYINAGQVGQAKNFRPLDDLSMRIQDALKGQRLPKKIYVDNYLDHSFFLAFFAHYVEKKKMKIIVSSKPLRVHDAADAMLDALENGIDMDDDDLEEGMKKDIRC